ncbi:hairy-related 5 [Anarrhichthys ocellatus]|uniref:hairy-related 5 n=1 Tax=Anarrhichthys ocellatus TaxID=433405 RepID=UPI0012ED265C|nr:transcription factor HES-7.1-B-like [Anarrhichthys ocellatus]
MKTVTSPESHLPRSMRRVPKPLMEKRRRERINQSLDTLRLLMLDSTDNEKLRNPKVEKAEILESVVNYLKREKGDAKDPRSTSRGQRQKAARQHSFHDGMRSCLLRVSHFVASKSKELEGTEEDAVHASLSSPEPQTHPSPGHIHMAQAALSPQQLAQCQGGMSPPYLDQRTGLHCDTRELLSSTEACTHITDPVWRPWPQ